MTVFYCNTALRFIDHTPQLLGRWSCYNDAMFCGV